MTPFTQRILPLAILLCMYYMIEARPQNGDETNVAEALRYLQELESKHAQFARPR